MAAGPLNKRVTIQRSTRTPDAAGQVVLSWADAVTVWASVEPLRGTEAIAAAQVEADMSHKVMIRGGQSVTVLDRLKLGTRYLAINSVRDLKEKGAFVELMCMEAKP